MEQICCALCGANNTELLFIGRDEWYGLSGDFPTVRCRQCGLIYLNPRPNHAEIGQFYPDDYTPYFRAIEDEPSWWQRLNRRLAMRKRLHLIQKFLPQPGHVLDVGCATGTFLETLRAQGWRAQGVELNGHAAEYARQRHGLDVFTGELVDAHFADNQFDLVVFWDVLEHVPQPRESLLEAARIAKPGGMLMLALPNPDSIEAHLFGQYWAGWDTPRHLFVYSEEAIHRFLQETGWQVINMSCLTGRIWLFNLSLEHWLQNKLPNERIHTIIMAVMRSFPVRVLSLPYFMIVERLKKGSIMAIFARNLEEKHRE